MQCSINRIREVKEKNVHCWHCYLYTGAVHYCLSESKWIHLDRFNRIIRYAATEKGATPTHPNDIGDGYVIGMEKFAIDNREEIYINRKAENAEKKRREQKEARATQELMLKRDAEEEKKQFQKQEDEELERKDKKDKDVLRK